MSHSHTDHEAHNAEAVAEIKKVTIILTVFTIIELMLDILSNVLVTLAILIFEAFEI